MVNCDHADALNILEHPRFSHINVINYYHTQFNLPLRITQIAQCIPSYRLCDNMVCMFLCSYFDYVQCLLFDLIVFAFVLIIRGE